MAESAATPPELADRIFLWRREDRTATFATTPKQPLELADSILDADWSPAGDLAVVRRVEGNLYQLEYPLGNVLYTSGKALYTPRVHPKGERVAFLDTSDRQVRVVDVKGKVETRGSFAVIWGGLAWSSDGEELWHGHGNEIHAVGPSGATRRVYRGQSAIRVDDISRDGEVLIFAHDRRAQVAVFSLEERKERVLTPFQDSELASISRNGQSVLFGAYSGRQAVTFLQGVGSTWPVRLGVARPLDLSSDGTSAVAAENGASALNIFPPRPGVARRLLLHDLRLGDVRWLHDNHRVVFSALKDGERQWRLFLLETEVSSPGKDWVWLTPVPLSDREVALGSLEVASDDRNVAAVSSDGTVTLFPLDGGEPIPLSELGTAFPIGWASSDQLWVYHRLTPVTVQLTRFDVRARQILEQRIVTPSDLLGVTNIFKLRVTPDGRSIAYNFTRTSGSLFVLDHLWPQRLPGEGWLRKWARAFQVSVGNPGWDSTIESSTPPTYHDNDLLIPSADASAALAETD
jgi:hypothetical protein